jgi:hypothetical protein
MILYTKTTIDPENIERESLPAHVALCAEREEAQNKRIEDIESRERDLKRFLLKLVTGATLSIISSLASMSFFLFDLLKK